jgi:hypothetical protein
MKPLLYINVLIGALSLFSCDKENISGNQRTVFIKYYTDYPVFKAADVAVTDDGYAILGTAVTADNKSYICLIRTDEYGNSLDSVRTYGQITNNTAYCLKVLDDGGFAILGSVINETTGFKAPYFVRTNNTGDILWSKTYSRDGNLEAKYFDVGPDESYHLTGYYDTVGFGKQIWWMGIDNSGNIIRNQRLRGYKITDDEGTHLEVLPDGRLVITGYSIKAQVMRPIIIKTDANGVYSDVYELDATINETGNCIRFFDDKNFLLLGNRYFTDQTETILRRIYMSPSSHNISWEKSYGSSVNDEGKCIVNDDQYIYVLGTSSRTGSNSTITITTTDFEGTELNRSEFGAGSHLSVSAFKRTSDQGFIIVGTNENPEANNTSLILIKTGADTRL